MEKNVGNGDRVIRILLGLALVAAIYFGHLTGIAALLAGLAAAALLISGLLSRCLIYKMVGIDTTVKETSYSTTDDRAGL